MLLAEADADDNTIQHLLLLSQIGMKITQLLYTYTSQLIFDNFQIIW